MRRRAGTLTLSLLSFILCSCMPNRPSVQAAAPNQLAANYNVQLGVGYLQEGQVARAKQKLLKALQQAPKWSEALDTMAYYQETTGNQDEAEKFYKKALYYAPKSGKALNNYGVFLCRNKRYEEAINYFSKAAADENYLEPADAYENAGLCALEIPNIEQAELYFKRALDQDPNRPTSLFELADLNFQGGNYKLAKTYLDQYNKYNPKLNAEALWLGIRLAKKLGDNSQVMAQGSKLQAKFPQSAEYQLYKRQMQS